MVQEHLYRSGNLGGMISPLKRFWIVVDTAHNLVKVIICIPSKHGSSDAQWPDLLERSRISLVRNLVSKDTKWGLKRSVVILSPDFTATDLDGVNASFQAPLILGIMVPAVKERSNVW